MREVVVDRAFVAAKVEAEAKHPTMADMKSLPGYRETETGWSAPASGAWGEAMTPYWRADQARHQANLGSAAYESRQRLRGRTQMYSDAAGKLWKRTDSGWVEV